MTRTLEWLARHAAPLLAASVFVGLALPPLAHLLRPYLVAFIVIPMVIALMRVAWARLASHARRPLTIALYGAWILALSPLVVWLVASLTGLPPALAAALVLMSAAPPIMAAPAFGLILGLDAALLVVVVVAHTAAAPLTLPPLALTLLGLEIDIGLGAFMARLGALVGGTFAVAALARRLAGPERLRRWSPRLDGIAVLSLAGFAIAIMDGVTAVLVARPGYVFACVALAFLANVALQAAGALLFAGGGRQAALSVGLTSGNRNMGLVLAALADRADFDVVVFFAVAQIPMYTLPALLLPLYRRLLRS